MSETADTTRPAERPMSLEQNSVETNSKPRAKVNEGVFLVSVQLAGNVKTCRQFAKVLAHRIEQLYGEFLHDGNLDQFDMHYNFNLSRWEKV